MTTGKLKVEREPQADVDLPPEIIDESRRYYVDGYPTLKRQSWFTRLMLAIVPYWPWGRVQVVDAVREDRLSEQLKNVHEENME